MGKKEGFPSKIILQMEQCQKWKSRSGTETDRDGEWKDQTDVTWNDRQESNGMIQKVEWQDERSRKEKFYYLHFKKKQLNSNGSDFEII